VKEVVVVDVEYVGRMEEQEKESRSLQISLGVR
jgi:hypothetical protein